MPSVIVNWSGQCPNSARRRDLLKKMEGIAEVSHGFFANPLPIRRFDHAIEGSILVSAGVLSEEARSRLSAPVAAGTEGDGGGMELRLAGPLHQKCVRVTEDLYAVHRAYLSGIEFRLYDGRGLYPSEDRVSFVFLSVEDCPAWDGALVYVEDREECRFYRSEAVQRADWFLTNPGIHLRYYLETWTDMLLGWAKHFYVPNLWYWRSGDLPNYEAFAGMDPEDERLRNAFYEALKGTFREEVANWSGTAAAASTLWSAAQK